MPNIVFVWPDVLCGRLCVLCFVGRIAESALYAATSTNVWEGVVPRRAGHLHPAKPGEPTPRSKRRHPSAVASIPACFSGSAPAVQHRFNPRAQEESASPQGTNNANESNQFTSSRMTRQFTHDHCHRVLSAGRRIGTAETAAGKTGRIGNSNAKVTRRTLLP